jgi:hypothetical protein
VRFAVIPLVVAALGWADARSSDEPARSKERSEIERTLFRAGAWAVDVSPRALPVLVNGGFLESRASRVNDPIAAKCLVLDDGTTRLAMVVVDSCMMPRELIDRAKALAQEQTGIPTERMLISATHTHSAPAAMGALGCAADAGYAALLPGLIAESIAGALKHLAPARIGWAVMDDEAHTFCRRWIRRPDKMLEDPFGARTVRANMHPGYESPDVVAPAGPVDPGLTIVAVQSPSGQPIAVFANYSMHYYGAQPVSADYFGRFAEALAIKLGAQAVEPPFVVIMSQGTSGDQMWMNYGQPRKDPGLDAYAASVANVASAAYRSIQYQEWVPLAMAETTLKLKRRIPDLARLAWARAILARMSDRDRKSELDCVPRTQTEVYAQEAVLLHNQPERELKLQAIKIGELGVTAIPNEVFAITGLKIKAQSPLDATMNVELANGAEGYIPPPEQHALGGYTTWPARTAGLEVQAEPQIVATILALLEQVAGKPRRALTITASTYAKAVLASRPVAYWRLDDMDGPAALDIVTNEHSARYENSVALYLPGASLGNPSRREPPNHAVHFAGGRLNASLKRLDGSYTVELWFWNGLPAAVRPIGGILFSFGSEDTGRTSGDRIGIGGSGALARRLFYSRLSDAGKVSGGKTEIALRTWHHVALVRDARRVSLYLDGRTQPELSVDGEVHAMNRPTVLVIGGDSDGQANFEGKLDEVAVFDRALSAQEISGHLHAAGGLDRPQ